MFFGVLVGPFRTIFACSLYGATFTLGANAAKRGARFHSAPASDTFFAGRALRVLRKEADQAFFAGMVFAREFTWETQAAGCAPWFCVATALTIRAKRRIRSFAHFADGALVAMGEGSADVGFLAYWRRYISST